MTTRRAGDPAKIGFYFNTRTWEMDLHRTNGAALPGGKDDRYIRVPALALVVLGPVLGFFFVMFLPCVGFMLVAREIAHRIATRLGRRMHGTAAAKTR